MTVDPAVRSSKVVLPPARKNIRRTGESARKKQRRPVEGAEKNPRPRRSFTPEFKAQIVELCRRKDRSVGQVCRDFNLTETTVRDWVKQAERAGDARQDGGLTGEERRELARLRRENLRLREDVETLKRVAALFAQQSR